MGSSRRSGATTPRSGTSSTSRGTCSTPSLIAIIGTIGTVASCTLVAYGLRPVPVPRARPLALPAHRHDLPARRGDADPDVHDLRQARLGRAPGCRCSSRRSSPTPSTCSCCASTCMTIPRDLDEAAAIDGAGPSRILTSVILPAGVAGDHRGRDLPLRLLVERLLRPADLPVRRAGAAAAPGRARQLRRHPLPEPGIHPGRHPDDPGHPGRPVHRLPAGLHPRHRHHRRRQVVPRTHVSRRPDLRRRAPRSAEPGRRHGTRARGAGRARRCRRRSSSRVAGPRRTRRSRAPIAADGATSSATTPSTMPGCRCCPRRLSSRCPGRGAGDPTRHRRRSAAMVPVSVRRGSHDEACSAGLSRLGYRETRLGRGRVRLAAANERAGPARDPSDGAIAHGDGTVVLLHPWTTATDLGLAVDHRRPAVREARHSSALDDARSEDRPRGRWRQLEDGRRPGRRDGAVSWERSVVRRPRTRPSASTPGWSGLPDSSPRSRRRSRTAGPISPIYSIAGADTPATSDGSRRPWRRGGFAASTSSETTRFGALASRARTAVGASS